MRDIRVVADLDGPGAAHVASQVATLVNPVGIAPGTPLDDVTTFTGFGRRHFLASAPACQFAR